MSHFSSLYISTLFWEVLEVDAIKWDTTHCSIAHVFTYVTRSANVEAMAMVDCFHSSLKMLQQLC